MFVAVKKKQDVWKKKKYNVYMVNFHCKITRGKKIAQMEKSLYNTPSLAYFNKHQKESKTYALEVKSDQEDLAYKS